MYSYTTTYIADYSGFFDATLRNLIHKLTRDFEIDKIKPDVFFSPANIPQQVNPS